MPWPFPVDSVGGIIGRWVQIAKLGAEGFETITVSARDATRAMRRFGREWSRALIEEREQAV